MPSKTSEDSLTMEQLLQEAGSAAVGLSAGDVVEGAVIAADKHEIWLDLGPRGTGLVIGREIEQSDDIKPGDTISASVLEPESDEGHAILSLKKVAKEKGWESLEARLASSEVFSVSAFDANKGGLLVEADGIRGFLPVSQLSAENYPRVSGADKDEILHRLTRLIGKPLRVRVLDLSRRENKLIFSEKAARREDTEGKVAKMKVGDKVTGVVTGVVDFGIFVNVDGVEGLVHISEIAWDRVDNPAKYVKVGESVEAKIISIDRDKLSLSMKQLQPDPWLEEVAALKVGDSVEGKITRITPFGAFVQVTPVIEALVHISELSREHVEDPGKLVKLGETKQFRVIAIDTGAHKLSLSLKEAKPKADKPSAAAESVPADKPATAGKTGQAPKTADKEPS
ncbi:S1 RNA-binding domain-containing protein [Candidatus Parcubacteria bacterium]|nr:S1 RNA-binding domain-containing protein [Candidatus Parcubacteria bacterium]